MTQTAISRGQEMMHIPIRELPEVARNYASFLCNKYGMCMETLFTAYTVYAQIIEKLPCDDILYTPNPEAIVWFQNNYLVN